jgi:sigma-B regulation protein RsbU (phosphoserine phosphatase)
VTTATTIDALQAQLELARQVQLSLLPEGQCCLSGWEVAFSCEAAGFVSGDYVDLIPSGPDSFYFALGDVSGKGVAASMLMSHPTDLIAFAPND